MEEIAVIQLDAKGVDSPNRSSNADTILAVILILLSDVLMYSFQSTLHQSDLNFLNVVYERR